MKIEEAVSLFNNSSNINPSETWLRKRKLTTIAFTVEVFFIGVEYSVVFLTLWSYINTLVGTSNPKLYYSIIASSYLISAVVMSVLFGKISDKTRETNKIFLVANCLAVIGNVLYMIYFSPAYLITGRLIAGCAAPLKSIIAGELARSYSKDQLISKFSLIGMSYGAGFLFGPAINFAFLKVDFYIFNLHITVSNAAGLYMAIIFSALSIIMYFFVYDLSKEFDLKAETEKLEDSRKRTHPSSKQDDCESTELLVKLRPKNTTLADINLVLLMFASYYIMMLMVSCDMDLPILIIDILQWSLLELNAIVFTVGALGVISMLYIAKRSMNEKALYFMFVFSLFACMLVLCIFVIIKSFPHSNALTIPLWCVWVVLFNIICVVEESYLTSAFAKMVPSEIQTFAESVRLGFARCGSITALATSAYFFDYFEYFAGFSCFVLLLILIFVIRRRNIFMHPREK